MSAKRIIWLVVSLLVVVFGIYTLNLSQKGPGEMEACTGALTVLEGARDPDFGISVDSPVLIRKVEMYQYVSHGSQTVTTDFSNNHEASQTVKELGQERTLHNPMFPDEPKAKVFCGKVEIGDSGLLLSEKLLNKFSLINYVDFDRQPAKLPVSGLADGPRVFDLEPLDDYTYATPGGDYWEVGDLRVTWYAVDPDDFAEVYTAVGAVEDGVIGAEDHVCWIFDREVDPEDVIERFGTRNLWTGIGLIAVGAVAAVICLLPVLRKKGKRAA